MSTVVVFDNDASSDDAIALMYLASQPDLTLAAITIAGTGEAHGINGAENMSDLWYMLGKPNIPIAYGSEKPCDSHGKPFPAGIRETIDKLFKGKNVPQNPNRDITNSAVDLIKKTVEAHEKITLLATGPLTNIAEFIKKYPHLINKIEKIVVMGGAIDVPGNIQVLDESSNNTVAEWNIYADPKACEIVFSSGIPVTLVPLDATNQVPMTLEFYNSLSQETNLSLKLIYELLKVFVDELGLEVFLDEFYLWDPLAAMICTHPELATIKRMPISVDLELAQTKQGDDNGNAAMINVVIEIPEAKSILNSLINEIKSKLPGRDAKFSNFFQSQQVNKDGLQYHGNRAKV